MGIGPMKLLLPKKADQRPETSRRAEGPRRDRIMASYGLGLSLGDPQNCVPFGFTFKPQKKGNLQNDNPIFRLEQARTPLAYQLKQVTTHHPNNFGCYMFWGKNLV